jgi:hypothetical protein
MVATTSLHRYTHITHTVNAQKNKLPEYINQSLQQNIRTILCNQNKSTNTQTNEIAE